MHVLVTGDCGYIGSMLSAQLSKKNNVVVFDNLHSGKKSFLKKFPEIEFVKGDISDQKSLSKVFSSNDFSALFHLAAESSVSLAEKNPAYAKRTNLLGAKKLFSTAAGTGVKKIIIASSMNGYGSNLIGEITESSPFFKAKDLCHSTQCEQEKFLEAICKSNGISGIALRFGIVYGNSIVQKPIAIDSVLNRFLRLAAAKMPLTVFGAGNQTKSLIGLSDAVELFSLAAADSGQNGFLPVNAATEVFSVNEIAIKIRETAERFGKNIAIKRLENPRKENEEQSAFSVNINRAKRIGFVQKNTVLKEIENAFSQQPF